MASALAGLIAGKLGGLVWDEATLLWTFKDDVDGMRETMEKLQAWMHDADKRSSQAEGETVRIWMKKFKAVAYDVEDLLDLFEAVQLMKQSQPKTKLLFSSYNPLLVRLIMAHKMKKVKEALDKIEQEGHHLNLASHKTPMLDLGSPNEPTIASTEEAIDIGMVGRDTEKEHIMKLLLKSEDEDISIIPIVGLGGLGKTTLAQAIFSDKRAEIFDLRVWVYVSKKFDLPRIGQIIISQINNSIGNGTSERYVPPQNGDLQTILEQLKIMLSTRRYLIVLDDVWEEDVNNLEKLKHMLRYGGKGSKIILTTRMQRVVEKMDVGMLANQGIIRPVRKSHQINLNFLSLDDCWNVMLKTAFRQDDDLGGLEEIGREIAMKCMGLPLLARSLGFLMSQDKSRHAWEDIRERKINLDVEEDKQMLQSLMLSYYYMPFHVKLCFTYCAVFPKGFAIASDHLIQQWRALGYIQPIDGHRCIKYLLGMSFLHISKSSQSAPEHAAAPDKLTMHDLVHDLASKILEKNLNVVDASEQVTWSRFEKRYCRHMRLVDYQKQSKALKEFPRKIRSLHLIQCSALQLRQKSFSKSKYLRVLDISGCSIEGKTAASNILLPSYIPDLMLLRYLDASGLPISKLPKSVHKLQNMQTLVLSNCTLEALPDDIGSLHNLGYLDLTGNSSLNKLPISLGKLSALSWLKLSGCSKLQELPESFDKLKCLQHLDLSGCCALQKLPDKFGSLPKLLFLNLSCCSKLVRLPDILNLVSLEHLNLSSCYELQNLPQDFGNVHKLEFLNISDCYKIEMLPESFCQLKHLKDLDLSDCHDLKKLPEGFGNLTKLHSLSLTSCSKLQSLPNSFHSLFKLNNLNLSYCVRLERLPTSFANLKLQVLDMRGCHALILFVSDIGYMTTLKRFQFISNDIPSLIRADYIRRYLKLHDITIHDVRNTDNGEHSSIVELEQLSCDKLQVGQLENVKNPVHAKRAELRNNPELRELSLTWKIEGSLMEKTDAEKSQLVLENLVPPRTLEYFVIEGYMSKDFPNWMLDISSYLPYLTYVRLVSLITCDSLPPFGQLPNLRSLKMECIPNIRKIGNEFYGEEGTCKKLRVIELKSLDNLEEWWTTRSGDQEFLVPNLHQLQVIDCPKLKFLPYPPSSMYWDLRNSDEVLPEHGFGRFSSATLPFKAYIESHNFSPEKCGRLQHLAPSLEILELSLHGKSSWRTSPEVTPCFPSLRSLCFYSVDQDVLPEWLGQLISLQSLDIRHCPNLTSLPESIQSLRALELLVIDDCPRLVESCRGNDTHKICHIPQVVLDRQRFHRRFVTSRKSYLIAKDFIPQQPTE